MKRRNVAGGVVIGAIVLGMYLANLWKGPGLGGEDTGTSTESVEADNTADVQTSLQPPAQPAESTSTLPYVTVVIHGNSYRITDGQNPNTGMDVSLDTVISRVAKVKGTTEGIRLRIMLDPSAQEGARSDLYSALEQNGIRSEAIQEISGFAG